MSLERGIAAGQLSPASLPGNVKSKQVVLFPAMLRDSQCLAAPSLLRHDVGVASQ